MPTLKEIKARIGSVQSTLKITSAMKLVSSAKLRKAQHAIEAMRPYEQALQQMLAAVSPDVSPQSAPTGEETVSGKTVIVAMAVHMRDRHACILDRHILRPHFQLQVLNPNQAHEIP